MRLELFKIDMKIHSIFGMDFCNFKNSGVCPHTDTEKNQSKGGNSAAKEMLGEKIRRRQFRNESL